MENLNIANFISVVPVGFIYFAAISAAGDPKFIPIQRKENFPVFFLIFFLGGDCGYPNVVANLNSAHHPNNLLQYVDEQQFLVSI